MPPKTPFLHPSAPCPCGAVQSLGRCCLPFIHRQDNPVSAEQLMRARYTAHVLLAIDYLWDTWSPEQRLRSSPDDIRTWAENCEWLGLQIISAEKGGVHDENGTVEFIATFRSQGEIHHHHEVSLFKKTWGKWLYVDHLA